MYFLKYIVRLKTSYIFLRAFYALVNKDLVLVENYCKLNLLSFKCEHFVIGQFFFY